MSCIGKGLDEADILITSGGVSMGEKVHDVSNVHILHGLSTLVGSTEARVGKGLQCHHSFWKSAHETWVHMHITSGEHCFFSTYILYMQLTCSV